MVIPLVKRYNKAKPGKSVKIPKLPPKKKPVKATLTERQKITPKNRLAYVRRQRKKMSKGQVK